MELTMQQLRIVLAVAEVSSFTRAGERLRLAQSSLSRAVADVERQVGVPLFERTTRTVELTTEGREFARVAGDVVSSYDRGMNHFAGFLDGIRGVVRIATLPSLAATLLPPIVSAFRHEHPEVSVSIEDALLGQVLEQVDGGHVDVAVTVDAERPAGLSFRPIAVDEFFCVFPSSHRFASAASLRWSDLQDEPFVGFDGASSVRAHVDRALARAGTTPGRTTQARNIAAVGGLVAAGLGVSAVPSLVLPLLEFARLARAPLIDPAVTRSIGVVTADGRPAAPAVRSFLRAVDAARSAGMELPAGSHWVNSVSSPERLA